MNGLAVIGAVYAKETGAALNRVGYDEVTTRIRVRGMWLVDKRGGNWTGRSLLGYAPNRRRVVWMGDVGAAWFVYHSSIHRLAASLIQC